MNALCAGDLWRRLDYDPSSGVFKWRTSSGGRKIGSLAGATDSHGYSVIIINRKQYKAHRLAWLYVVGEWPSGEIDHINRKPSDNRFSNLRVATRQQNCCNLSVNKRNSTGYKGVTLHAKSGMFNARIKHGRKTYWLGSYHTAEEASRAYDMASRHHHGTFGCEG